MNLSSWFTIILALVEPTIAGKVSSGISVTASPTTAILSQFPSLHAGKDSIFSEISPSQKASSVRYNAVPKAIVPPFNIQSANPPSFIPAHDGYPKKQTSNEVQNSQQKNLNNALAPGDVFGLITVSDDRDVNGETVVIYNDGTLGIKEPSAPGYLFQAVLLQEYNLLVVPEPMTTVKLNDKNVYFLNDSMFNPAPFFVAQDWNLKTKEGSTVVCPSWNSVLVYIKDGQDPPCEDAVSVNLGIVPIPA